MTRSTSLALLFILVSAASSLYIEQPSELNGDENWALNSHGGELSRSRRQGPAGSWPVLPPALTGAARPPPPINSRPATPRPTSRPTERPTTPKPTTRPTRSPTRRPGSPIAVRPHTPPPRPVPVRQTIPPPPTRVPAGPTFPPRQPHYAFYHFYD